MKRILLTLCVTLALQQSYAQDLSKGHTFTDGDTVHAADLNTLVDSATILSTFISNKGAATPLTSDLLVFNQGSTNSLKAVSLANLLDAGGALLSTTTRTANTFLSGPASGSAAAPTWRTIAPRDTAIASPNIAATTVDCSLARTFGKVLSANTNFTITNLADGETVTVALAQAASGGPYVVGFSGVTVHWKGGVAPTQTTTANKIDLYTFINIGGAVYGSASQNY